MNQRNTTKTILAVIVAAAFVVSVGSLTALHTFPADATKPKHTDDNDNDNGNNAGGDNVVNTLTQQPPLAPLSMELLLILEVTFRVTTLLPWNNKHNLKHSSKNNYKHNKQHHQQTQHVDKS